MVHGVVKRGLSSSLAAVAMLAVLMLSVSLPARAEGQDLAEHFGGAALIIIVGSGPGGAYDIFGRLVSRFVGKYLPGEPASFVVRNIPGAGQLRGLRATMRAKPDGLTIGLMHPRFIQRELLGIDVPDFDLDTVRVLGSPSGGIKRQHLKNLIAEP